MLMLRLRNLDGRMADMRHGMIGHWRSCRLWIQVGSYIVPGVGFANQDPTHQKGTYVDPFSQLFKQCERFNLYDE
jgi:hypothetical protein